MNIAIDYFHQSLIKKNESVCGDHTVYSYDDTQFLCVLADGLGSGVKANILAHLTATMLHRLFKEGVDLEESIASISATLPQCQERNIAYSTFSLLQIKQDGSCLLVEFDNPFIHVIRNQEIVPLKRESHWYQDRLVYSCECTLQDNDVVVMISDGALYASNSETLNNHWHESDVYQHIVRTLSTNDTARNIGQYLIKSINTLYDNQPQDDVSVIICKMFKQTNSVIMVGPPKEKAHDAIIVEQLLKADGLKMVCGGTTSQIVARECKKKLIIDDVYFNRSDLPPTAHIDGIDFVSEGILTLGRCVDYFVEATTNDQFKEYLSNSQAKDGAHQLFQMLVNDCSKITFYVGQAQNDAHNVLSTSLSVNMKNKLVKRIATHLQKFNKLVTIHYV